MVSRIKVTGGSMSPSIRDGDEVEVVFFQNAPPPIRPGDVVCYAYEDRCLIHRVLRANERGIMVAGDGGVDPHVICPEAVMGRVNLPWWNRGWPGLSLYYAVQGLRKVNGRRVHAGGV